MSQPKSEFDSAWKEILEVYFKQFVSYCWQEHYTEIDWTKGYKTLDKELNKISRDAPIGNREADKLIEVCLNDGQITFILIHIEVQANYDLRFAERMLLYRYRIRDLYKKPIASLAILIDDGESWRPEIYKEELWGSRLEIQFPIIKLTDYKSKIKELEASNNPFAQVILAQLIALEKQDQEKRLISKIALTRHLYIKGWSKNDIIMLYKFLDWVIALSGSYELKYHQEVQKIEKDLHMGYITTAERIGIQQGIHQGESNVLLRLLRYKFKNIPSIYLQKIDKASIEDLLKLAERVLESSSLEKVFED
jgi:hypothetical protein